MGKITKAILIVFASVWLIKEIAVPGIVAATMSYTYMELAYECDTAMEASWYYSQMQSMKRETEVTQLLVCHDYDTARKLMLMSGLPEAYLSWLGLESLELYQRSPEEFVKQHRFTGR